MRRQAGFTLLEVVIVMAITGFVILFVGQVVRFGLTAWDMQGRLSSNRAELEAADRSLRTIIENLFAGDDSDKPPMTGSATALTGVSRIALPGGRLDAAPVEVGLALSGNRLVLRWRPYIHAASAAGPPGEATLVNGVERLTIAYWQPTGSWASSWNQADLPALIRLRLTFLNKAGAPWPDLIMAPLLARP